MSIFGRKARTDRSKTPQTDTTFDPYPPTEVEDVHRVNEAISLMQNKDIKGAIQALLKVVERLPETYVNQFERDGALCIKFWDMQQFQDYVAWMQAHSTLREVHWVGNAYPRACFHLGYLLMEIGDLEHAPVILKQGLRLEPDNPRLLCEIAQAQIRLRHFDEALTNYEKVLALGNALTTRDRAIAMRGKSFILIEQGNLEAAERTLLESLEFDPTNSLARNELQHIRLLRDRPAYLKRLGITVDEFNLHYASYRFALSQHDKNGNDDIDNLARSIGLSEQEIKQAQNDLHQAILNRIVVRVAMDRRMGGG